MSRWRRQQRKRAGQRRWLEKRVAEFQRLLAEEMRRAMADFFIPSPAAEVPSPRAVLTRLRASLESYIKDPATLGPWELVKLEDLYR